MLVLKIWQLDDEKNVDKGLNEHNLLNWLTMKVKGLAPSPVPPF